MGGFCIWQKPKSPSGLGFCVEVEKKATRLSRLSLAIRLSGYSMTSNTLLWHRRGEFRADLSGN
ncbi:Unknown protein sequence [Pseudomonas amygdali pv. mellea]|nr:Unknown protein sequence [Pseudomonas amygdali pv. mellea]